MSTKKGQGDRNNSAPLFTSSTISISNLLDIVKETHQSILSKDVLRHFNMEKSKGGYYSDRTLYQLRETSYRELLADALTSVAKTPEELSQYIVQRTTMRKTVFLRQYCTQAETQTKSHKQIMNMIGLSKK